uniref:Lysosomal dipeptide transporter MFSD1 n=1 Tax=Schistocephalus solidus TaxID=70667 RepID=A0A0V0JB88_SCHSO
MSSGYEPIGGEVSERNCCYTCAHSKACDPHSRLHRYLMLFFLCFMSFGSYFCYDNPAAMQDIFLKDVHLTVSQFMNLYAFYSWPNVVISLLGGFLIDRVFGVRWGGIIFSLVIFGGQLVFGIAVMFSSVPLMYFARFIFGIGGESLAVAQNTYATVWFKPNELNFVFGLTISMARIGSTVNMNAMQPLFLEVGRSFNITGETQVGASLLIASVTCLLSAFCAVMLAFFFKRYLRASKPICIQESSLNTATSDSLTTCRQPPDALPENDLYESSPLLPSSSTPTVPQREKTIRLVDICRFPLAIWLICIICVSYYVTVFPFVSLGLVFFERKYDLAPSSAAAVNSLVYILSAFASPLCGGAIDCTGRNLVWLTVGILLTTVSHLFFAFTSSVPPALLMVLLGISYSILASSLWPLVGIILPQYQRATAYGLIQSVQNLGLGLVSILAGYIVDTKGYLFLELFFLLCLSIALASTLCLYLWDLNHGSILNSGGQRNSSKPVIVVETTDAASSTDA